MADETTLYAGVARADITPPVGIAHANWGAAVHTRAEGIDLPMWASVLALRDGSNGTSAVIVDLDLLHLSLPMAGAIRDAVAGITGIPHAHVRVSVTHTHSGPTIGNTWVEEGAELIEGYAGSLAGRIAGAAWEATQRLTPVRLATGTGECRIGVNRRFRGPDGRTLVGRNREGFFDPTVRVMRLDTVDGQPLAAIVHYATHPTTMAFANRLITPDYPGLVRRTVEQVTDATCLFLQGCAGDAGPAVGITEGHTGDTSYYHRAGKILGAEAAKVFLTLETEPYEEVFAGVVESGAPLASYRHEPTPAQPTALQIKIGTATLPVRPFPSRVEGEARAREAKDTLNHLRRSGASEDEVRDATYRAKRLSQQAGHSRLTDGSAEVEVEIHAIRVGPAVFLGSPVEVFNALGAAVAQRSPFAWTAVSGYTNGSAGYLPTAEAFESGGYEVEMASAYARGAGERWVEAAVNLLERLHGS
jgi:neutral ceramidase